jgi:alpha-glucuronidase
MATRSPIHDEDGYRLWLRYRKVDDARLTDHYRRAFHAVVVEGHTPTERIILNELTQGLSGLLGVKVASSKELCSNGTVLAGTPETSPFIARLKWDRDLRHLGKEGYRIRSLTLGGRRVTVIAAEGVAGALYGCFHLLRLIQTHRPIDHLKIDEKPCFKLRLLNHWDNLDGSIERGYAGKSLWKWKDLPGKLDKRITDYARANASLGLNGAVLNNVNASPDSLSLPYLKKAAAIASVLRPYGIRVFLSANFAAPKKLGSLSTSDPLDQKVQRWWKDKADEIYRLIPDFGGFLVKANSEGQSGPQDYGRTHAEGANLLARALFTHGGIVMWRAFVYNEQLDPDRIKRAYLEFKPLDSKFLKNVLVQPKNGPLDFQPHEPFHPLFGSMPKTPLLAELQVTQEYMGHSTHLVYLASLWSEFLNADTYTKGPGSRVYQVANGTLHGHTLNGIAGVANTGSDRNWCGHHFAQANWHAFGRLAFNPKLTPESLAEEWARMTWGNSKDVVKSIKAMMLSSRKTFADYCMPLGLHGVHGKDFHYEPMPWNIDPRRPDWSSTYYNRADEKGLGFDRTLKGSAAVNQYHPPLNRKFNSLASCPEEFLLWFHHVPWDHRMKSGRSFWQELCRRYHTGAQHARQMERQWNALKNKVDKARHQNVAEKLHRQAQDAREWAEQCLRYFQAFSKKPIPRDI